MKTVGALMFQNEMLASGVKPHIVPFESTDYDDKPITRYRAEFRHGRAWASSESESILDAYDGLMMSMSRAGRINFAGEDINNHGIVKFLDPDEEPVRCEARMGAEHNEWLS